MKSSEIVNKEHLPKERVHSDTRKSMRPIRGLKRSLLLRLTLSNAVYHSKYPKNRSKCSTPLADAIRFGFAQEDNWHDRICTRRETVCGGLTPVNRLCNRTCT